MPWRFLLCELDGRPVGELAAADRKFTPGVSKMATASGRIRDTDPLFDHLAAGDTTLKVYDSAETLRLWGPVVSDEETGSGQGSSVTFAAADQAFELSKRFLGKDPAGLGTTHTAKDSGQIAVDNLAAVNAEFPTGIIAGDRDPFVSRTVTHLWTNMLDSVAELGAIEGSYEWGLRYADGVPPTVYLDLKAQLGSDRTSDVFLEYGCGQRNTRGYSRVRTIDRQATRVWALGAGSTLVAQAYDAGAEARYARRREDVVTYGDITVAALIDALAAAHVAIRRQPRTTIQLTPRGVAGPKYGVDYVVGDVATGRVQVGSSVRVNGPVRIWSADITLDSAGNEAAGLTLAAEGS